MTTPASDCFFRLYGTGFEVGLPDMVLSPFNRSFPFFRTISLCYCIFAWQADTIWIVVVKTAPVARSVIVIVIDSKVQDAHLRVCHITFTTPMLIPYERSNTIRLYNSSGIAYVSEFSTPEGNDPSIVTLTKYFTSTPPATSSLQPSSPAAGTR